MFAERFEYTDEKYQDILQNFNDLVDLQGRFGVQVSPLCKQDTALSNLFLYQDLSRQAP